MLQPSHLSQTVIGAHSLQGGYRNRQATQTGLPKTVMLPENKNKNHSLTNLDHYSLTLKPRRTTLRNTTGTIHTTILLERDPFNLCFLSLVSRQFQNLFLLQFPVPSFISQYGQLGRYLETPGFFMVVVMFFHPLQCFTGC